MKISGVVRKIIQEIDGTSYLELTDVVCWTNENDRSVLQGKLNVVCRKSQLMIHVSAMQSQRIVIDTWQSPIFNLSASVHELTASYINSVSL